MGRASGGYRTHDRPIFTSGRGFRDFGFKRIRGRFECIALGRAKGSFGAAKDFIRVLEKMSDAEFGETMVDSITLYKSELTKDGPIYTVIRKFAFGPKVILRHKMSFLRGLKVIFIFDLKISKGGSLYEQRSADA